MAVLWVVDVVDVNTAAGFDFSFGHHLLAEVEASYKWIKYAQLSNHLTQNVAMVLLAIINDKLLPLSAQQ